MKMVEASPRGLRAVPRASEQVDLYRGGSGRTRVQIGQRAVLDVSDTFPVGHLRLVLEALRDREG